MATWATRQTGGNYHAHPHPQSPSQSPSHPHSSGTVTQICQTRPLPRLACEHVPASVPDIRAAVLPSRAQSTVGCPLASHSPRHLACAVGWRAGSHVPPAAPHPNSCHGDQSLIPSEYSDDDVESLSSGRGGGGSQPYRARACACACVPVCLCLAVLARPLLPHPIPLLPPAQAPGSWI